MLIVPGTVTRLDPLYDGLKQVSTIMEPVAQTILYALEATYMPYL